MVYIEYGRFVVGTKSPPGQNPPQNTKIQNLIYNSVDHNGVQLGVILVQESKKPKPSQQNIYYKYLLGPPYHS